MFDSEIANFVAVLAVAVAAAGAISTLYAVGLNLWARGSALDSQGNARIMLRVGSVVCFTACVAIVLFALWLMVPLFH